MSTDDMALYERRLKRGDHVYYANGLTIIHRSTDRRMAQVFRQGSIPMRAELTRVMAAAPELLHALEMLYTAVKTSGALPADASYMVRARDLLGKMPARFKTVKER